VSLVLLGVCWIAAWTERRYDSDGAGFVAMITGILGTPMLIAETVGVSLWFFTKVL